VGGYLAGKSGCIDGGRVRKKGRAAYKKAGYEKERNPRGSHTICSKDGPKITVPAKIKKRHTANGILKEAGIPDRP